MHRTGKLVRLKMTPAGKQMLTEKLYRKQIMRGIISLLSAEDQAQNDPHLS